MTGGGSNTPPGQRQTHRTARCISEHFFSLFIVCVWYVQLREKMDVLLLLELFIFRYYLWGVHFIMIVGLLHFQGFVSRIYRPAFVGKCGPGKRIIPFEHFRLFLGQALGPSNELISSMEHMALPMTALSSALMRAMGIGRAVCVWVFVCICVYKLVCGCVRGFVWLFRLVWMYRVMFKS